MLFPTFSSTSSTTTTATTVAAAAAAASAVTSSFEARLPTWEILQETTARLLFMAVKWVRCLDTFQTLSKNDQQLLLQVSAIFYFIARTFQLKIYFIIFITLLYAYLIYIT